MGTYSSGSNCLQAFSTEMLRFLSCCLNLLTKLLVLSTDFWNFKHPALTKPFSSSQQLKYSISPISFSLCDSAPPRLLLLLLEMAFPSSFILHMTILLIGFFIIFHKTSNSLVLTLTPKACNPVLNSILDILPLKLTSKLQKNSKGLSFLTVSSAATFCKISQLRLTLRPRVFSILSIRF